jgi:Arc/MetJ family transcription regulator
MIIDDALMQQAMRLTGLDEKTAVVHAGLRALIAHASAERLRKLAGSDPSASAPPRRRPASEPKRRGRGR